MAALSQAGRSFAVSALFLSGCSTLPDGHAWGERATLTPGWERIRASALSAGRDPWVWAPLLGAGVLQIDNWDHRISDWARTETPLFGSTDDAARWSDDLRTTAHVAFLTSVAFTPSGDAAPDWFLNKAKGLGIQVSAAAVATGTTRLLKDATNRERPNGEDDESFPSGHTTSSAVFGRLAAENLDSIEINRPLRIGLDVGLDAVTIGTAWARIEAGAHFPSDTLFGMALGNFCGMFFNDAFLGLGSGSVSLAFVPQSGGGEIRWQVGFGER